MKTSLLIVDPQNDFCHPEGSLYVPGAENDCKRLTELINKFSTKIDSIHITLDTHHYFDIAHPIFWLDQNGKNPTPYTIIKAEDVRSGIWRVSVEKYSYRALEYLKLLEMSNNYNCCIWPPHCLLGSWGGEIIEDLLKSIYKWERTNPGKVVDFIQKGKNIFTEHYSAVRAEVPDPEDRETMTNMNLINALKDSDLILVGGEALSHCVCNTLKDLIEYIPVEKFCILTDATSNVIGFENYGKEFLASMTEKNMKLATTEEINL